MSKPVKDVIHFPGPLVVSAPNHRPPPEKKPAEQVETNKVTPITIMNQTYENNKIVFSNIRNATMMEGFDISSIVARRLHGDYKPAMNPRNWGVVVRWNIYTQRIEDYQPLVVRWFHKLDRTVDESAHVLDDLYLIHPAVSDQDLEISLLVQEEDLKESDNTDESAEITIDLKQE